MEANSFEKAVAMCKTPRKASTFTPSEDLIFSFGAKKPLRNIFAFQPFLPFEIVKLERLKKEIEKENVKIPPNWDDAFLLRIIHGSDYKTRKAFKDLKRSIAAYELHFPTPLWTLLPKVLEVLKTGFIYIHGRDKFFRPAILVFPGRIDIRRFTPENYVEGAIFIMQFMIENMMIPGKAENWINLVDMEGIGITQLPMKSLMRIAATISDLFKCRLAHMYIMNPPSTMLFIWKLVSPFMDKVTRSKVIFLKKEITQEVRDLYHPSQLERKYGGTLEDITTYWPPTVPKFKGKGKGERIRENNPDEIVPRSQIDSEIEDQEDDSVLSEAKSRHSQQDDHDMILDEEVKVQKEGKDKKPKRKRSG